RAGADLVVCDLNEAGLEETAGMIRGLGRRVLARRVDVASRAAMGTFAAEVHREREAVDVVMNNAGVGLGERFLETPIEDGEWMQSITLWRLGGRAASPGARQFAIDAYRRRNYGPERVAVNILKAVARNRAVAPISPEAWAMYLMKRFAPRLTARLNRALAARMERAMAASDAHASASS